MNIEKLAKHLKEFTLDEINMIAECDCKTELEQLLNSNKICFEQGLYKYNENSKTLDYGIIIEPIVDKDIDFESAVEYFLKNYAYKFCAKRTVETYISLFKLNITVFFKKKTLNNITNEDIKNFYIFCKNRNLGVRRLQSTLVLLNQFLKYCKSEKLSNVGCNFQVKRISNKYNSNVDKLIFKE